MNQKALNTYADELEALAPETPEGAEAAPDFLGIFKYIRDLATALKDGNFDAILAAAYELLGLYVNRPKPPDGTEFAMGGLWLKLLPLLLKILGELKLSAPA